MSFFSSYFKDFSSSLDFSKLIIICLVYLVFFEVILFGVCWASCICKIITFINMYSLLFLNCPYRHSSAYSELYSFIHRIRGSSADFFLYSGTSPSLYSLWGLLLLLFPWPQEKATRENFKHTHVHTHTHRNSILCNCFFKFWLSSNIKLSCCCCCFVLFFHFST